MAPRVLFGTIRLLDISTLLGAGIWARACFTTITRFILPEVLTSIAIITAVLRSVTTRSSTHGAMAELRWVHINPVRSGTPSNNSKSTIM